MSRPDRVERKDVDVAGDVGVDDHGGLDRADPGGNRQPQVVRDDIDVGGPQLGKQRVADAECWARAPTATQRRDGRGCRSRGCVGAGARWSRCWWSRCRRWRCRWLRWWASEGRPRFRSPSATTPYTPRSPTRTRRRHAARQRIGSAMRRGVDDGRPIPDRVHAVAGQDPAASEHPSALPVRQPEFRACRARTARRPTG